MLVVLKDSFKKSFDLKRMLFIVPEATFGGKGGNKVK